MSVFSAEYIEFKMSYVFEESNSETNMIKRWSNSFLREIFSRKVFVFKSMSTRALQFGISLLLDGR